MTGSASALVLFAHPAVRRSRVHRALAADEHTDELERIQHSDQTHLRGDDGFAWNTDGLRAELGDGDR